MKASFRDSACVLLIAFLGMAYKCDDDPPRDTSNYSENIETDALILSLRVASHDDSSSEVIAHISQHTPDVIRANVNLNTGDHLEACLDDECMILSRSNAPGGGYRAMLPFEADGEYVVSLERSNALSAPDNSVYMPPLFDLLSPGDDEVVTDGDTILIDWSPPPPGDVSVRPELDATCVFEGAGGFEFSVPRRFPAENGDDSVAIEVDSLMDEFIRPYVYTAVIASCDFEVSVTFDRTGAVDPNLHSGSVRAEVVRTANLRYLPTL